jgi:protein-S-isoprenylcysteine O-methyltransferase Ste14
MSTSASAPAVVPSREHPARHWSYALLQLATRKRILVSLIIFGSLVAADLLIWRTRPCNPLDLFDPSTVIGELLILAGLLIRTWAAGTILKSKSLTMTGPYEFVRNPLYIGSFLMMFGFALLLRDWIAMWVFLGPILAMYLNKVRQEEVYLARNYPDVWPTYAAQTPRFLPLAIRRPSLAGFSWEQWIINCEFHAVGASILGLFAIWGWHRLIA